jgi:polysaccharide pyruvyl transferase WcaK-like protein
LTTQLHGLPSFPIAGSGSGRLCLLREIRHVFLARRLLGETDFLVMSGGGQIDDFWGGAFGQPYALFKWAALARFTRIPVVFLSVGVCSLRSRLSRRFAFWALRLAVYRSYRDHGSKQLLHDAAFTRADPECPDIAFSHPRGRQLAVSSSRPARSSLVVGISPIIYLSSHGWPEQDLAVYERYLQTLGQFVAEVLGAGHNVVLFVSATQDHFAVKDLQGKLRLMPGGDSWGDRLRESTPSSAGELLDAIDRMDLVVASRLHGVILSHVMGKPVLALSYDRKVDAHMEAMGQRRFCLDLHDFTLNQLRDGFADIAMELPAISAVIRSSLDEFRKKLDLQYHLLPRLITTST